MEQTDYPLHIIHQYTMRRRAAESFLEIIDRQSRRSLERIATINRRRLEVVPLAAAILRRLIAVGRPDRLVFSAYGLREGYAYSLLSPDTRADPLIAACIGMAASQSRWRSDGDRLQQWTAAVFADLDGHARRLHRAACWLSDIAWTEHPDYRAEHAFFRSLRMPVGAIAHRERVFIALALHARYGGGIGDPVTVPTRGLLDDAAAAEARILGLALRLAYTLCGGALSLLDQVRLRRDSNGLILEVPANGSLFTGEAVQRRLDALGRALGLATRTLRRRSPSPALA
jgi:exopolyphosphatase/guanosine-5'-triphosphate,3'-diphosphate pyrophosphatase